MTHTPLYLGPDLQKKVDFARLQTVPSPVDIRVVLNCLDLTSLTGQETAAQISDLCEKAKFYELASVCIFPQHVRQAAQELKGTGVRVATVINFPFGNKRTGRDEVATNQTISKDIWAALKDGARQIDIVQPYTERPGLAHDFIRAARLVTPPSATLKVILESAAYNDSLALYNAAFVAIASGADCVKTSTGKHPHGGATLEAAGIMMEAIARSPRQAGIKITGGVSSLEDCLKYMALKKMFSDASAINPSNFRLGSSRLLETMVSDGYIEDFQPI